MGAAGPAEVVVAVVVAVVREGGGDGTHILLTRKATDPSFRTTQPYISLRCFNARKLM
jgi:hypothetical protein